jgi:hypothetical protein
MANHSHPDGPLVGLTVKYPRSFLDELHALGAGGSQADNIRTVGAFGLRCLKEPNALEALDLSLQVERLQEAAARIAAAAAPASRTPAGSHWAPNPAALPDELHPGEIVATPSGVIARLRGGSFTLDAGEGSLMLVSEAGRIWQTTIDRRGLALLVPAWASALIPLATSQPGETFPLPLGLSLERLPDGGLVLAGGELQLGLGAAEAFQLSAELASLLAARLRLEGDRVQGLNGALAATPEVQEVAR